MIDIEFRNLDEVTNFLTEVEQQLISTSEQLAKIPVNDKILSDLQFVIIKTRAAKNGMKDFKEAFSTLPDITSRLNE